MNWYKWAQKFVSDIKSYLDVGHNSKEVYLYFIDKDFKIKVKKAGNKDYPTHANILTPTELNKAIVMGRYDPDTHITSLIFARPEFASSISKEDKNFIKDMLKRKFKNPHIVEFEYNSLKPIN